jgi:hypothetical protein
MEMDASGQNKFLKKLNPELGFFIAPCFAFCEHLRKIEKSNLCEPKTV